MRLWALVISVSILLSSCSNSLPSLAAPTQRSEPGTSVPYSDQDQTTKPIPTATKRSLMSTQTYTPGIMQLVKPGTTDEDMAVNSIIEAFINDTGVASLDGLSKLTTGMSDYSDGWVITRNSEFMSIEMGFDLLLLGSYWIDLDGFAIGNTVGRAGDVLQMIVLYSPKFKTILRGALAIQSGNSFELVPVILKDNTFDLAMSGEFDIKLKLTSLDQTRQWVDRHLGYLVYTSIVIYYEDPAWLVSCDCVTNFVKESIESPSRYVTINTINHPILSEEYIPNIISSFGADTLGAIIAGLEPHGEKISDIAK